jgi:RHS repeat-associated protein
VGRLAGGLLGIREAAGRTLTICGEVNGNVMGLVDGATNSLVARWDYDAFGNLVTTWSAEEGNELCPIGFSTKYRDRETELLYFGYRYYAPAVGRWLGKDPIEEDGGIALYGMVGNNTLSNWDYLGLAGCRCKCKQGQKDLASDLNNHVNGIIRAAKGDIMKVWNALVPSTGPWPHLTGIESWLQNTHGKDMEGLGDILARAQWAGCMNLCSKCVGTDKVGHFFEEGYLYRLMSQAYGNGSGAKWGEYSEGVSGRSLPGVTPPGFIFSGGSIPAGYVPPKGFFGDHHTSKPIGLADLEANAAGENFWNELDDVGSAVNFNICDYVTDLWDENINPNK